jgi:hypothetical protein
MALRDDRPPAAIDRCPNDGSGWKLIQVTLSENRLSAGNTS